MTDTKADEELLAALGVAAEPEPERKYTAREERLLAGFEDIQRFYEQHGRAPLHGEDRDIFERLYAVRLDRLRALTEALELLTPLDTHRLLTSPSGKPSAGAPGADDAALLADLGVGAPAGDDITVLKHVRSAQARRAAEDVADRRPCEDFARFQPLFEQVEHELHSDLRETLRFGRDASIEVGNFFILGGQIAYVAEAGEDFDSPQGKKDNRLRVIYANGTESNLLRLSLARALYKDEAGRRITATDNGPLFAEQLDEGEATSGTIYVLRSNSTEPFVTEHRELVHKIGVTSGSVEKRIADAEHDTTYLLASVEIVATYRLAHIRPFKLEALLHRIFAPAQLDLTIQDRFGKPVKPREWFLVPLSAIDEAVDRIRDGSITRVVYDSATGRMVSDERLR